MVPAVGVRVAFSGQVGQLSVSQEEPVLVGVVESPQVPIAVVPPAEEVADLVDEGLYDQQDGKLI